jgi:hypothetical protein
MPRKSPRLVLPRQATPLIANLLREVPLSPGLVSVFDEVSDAPAQRTRFPSTWPPMNFALAVEGSMSSVSPTTALAH